MARIKKYSPEQKLSSFQTLILDENPNSDYFRITEFKDTFTGGKNGFLIEGSQYLKESTEIKLELLDVEGNPIYFEPGNGIPEYYEGISKLIAVYIYNDTPIGLGKITVLGELKKYDDNGVIRDVPDQWKGTYNVKWERTFQINKSLANEDKVRFYRRPEVTISEIVKPIFSGNPPSVTQTGSVNGIPLVPLAGSNLSDFILPTSYRLKINSGNKWTGSVEGEKLLFDNITYSPIVEEIVNETEIIVSPPYTENNIVTSFTNEDYSVEFPYIEGVGDLATALTGSFAKISITDMKTFVGDAARVKIFRRSQNNLTDFEFVQEIQLESNELLRDITTFAKKEEPYGFFSQAVLDDYWVTSSIDFDVTFNQNFLYNSAKLNSTPTNYFFTYESFAIQSGVEYTLDLNVRKETTDPNAYLKVFLSGSYNGKGVEQQIANIPSSTFLLQKTNFSENILANNFDNAKLYFEASGSDWYVNNVSLKASQETSFSPDEITFIQQVPKLLVEETFDYRFEFYDINNNYIPIFVEDTKTFTGGNTNLFKKSIELNPDNLYFSFDSASNPANAVPPLTIAIDVDTTLVTGSITYTSGAYDFFGNLLSSSQYVGGIYPGYLTDWDVDSGRQPFLRVQDFTGSRDDISVQFIRYTGAIEGVSDTFVISRVEDGKGGVSFEIVPFRGVQIKNKESKTLEIQAIRVDGINRIDLRAGLDRGFSDAKLHLLSSSLDGTQTYVSLSQAITNPNFIEGVSAGTTGSGEIDYNATFNRDAIDNELTVYLMDGPTTESILTSQILTDLKDGLNPGLITSQADQFNIKYKPRELFSFDPSQIIITSSFQQRGTTLNPLTASLIVKPSASIQPLTELPELFVFYDTGAFDDTITVAVTDAIGNSIDSGVPGVSVPYYNATQTKQLNFEFTYTEPITSASVTANKTFFITPDGLPGQDSIVIDVDPNPISLGSNHKGEVVNYSLANTDIQITQGDLFLINTASGDPGTFTTTSVVPTNIVFETLVGDSTTTMNLAGFESMSALSASVKYDFEIHPYFTSSLITASKTQKFTKVIDGGGPIEITLDPIATALNADEVGFVSNYSSATTEVFIKQNDEPFYYDEFDGGRPGTFVTESITLKNIQFSEVSSSFRDLIASGSISSSDGEILHFKGFSGLANNQPSASIVYKFKVYPYSLTGGVAGVPRIVSKTQTLSKVSDGTAARKVSLVASSDVVVYDGDGIKVAPSGDVQLSATAINVTGSAFFTFLNNDGSTIQASSTNNTTTVGDLPATGSTKTFSVELRDGLVNGTIVDTDSVTISGISEGSTVYTAQLSNPASSVTVEVDGTTFLENTSTLIRAYKGGSELQFVEEYDEEAVDPNTFLPIGTFGQFSASIHQISTYLTHDGGTVDETASQLYGTSDGISVWNSSQQNSQGFIIFKIDFENGRGEQFIQQSFSAVFEGATGPGIVMRGEWTGSLAYIFDQGNQRRDAVLRDVSGTTHYWATTQLVPSGSEYIDGDNVYTIEPILPSQTNPDGTYVEGTIDTNGWEYLGEQELFVAAKIAIFDESFVKNTINVGIPPAGNPNAQIAIAGGTDEPYISVGQTGVQGYGQPGAFIGVSNDFGGEGAGANSTSGILSLTGTSVGGKYNQLAWDGSTLTIKGAIRQTAEGIVESRNLGLWSATSTGFGFRFGDIVSNNNITWQCKLAHIRNTAPSTDAVAEPGGSGAYTTYWEESDLSAKSLRLSADSQIFRVAQNGTITPSTITLTANRQNIGSSTTYTSNPSITVGGSGDTATITPAQFGSNTSVTLTAVAGGFEDEMTIVKLQEGTDAITVVNSNQSHTLQTSEAGTVTYTDSGTTIEVFEGATPLTFTTGTVVASTFSIATSVTNIVAFNGGNLNSQDTNTTVTTPDHGTMTQSQASIVYTITGKKANGDAFTVTTTQSFSKAIAGSSAESIRLSADSQIFRINQDGTPTPSTITITADRQNVSTSTTFTTNPTITSTVSGDTLTITHANFSQGGAQTKNTITATAGAVSDEITIVEVREGTDAITSILTNEAHTLNATSAGVVSDFTNSGTELVAYEGANQLTFQKPNTIVTNKSFEADTTDTHSDGDDGFSFVEGDIGVGTTSDITNIWSILAELGVLWVRDADVNGNYFTHLADSSYGNYAKVKSITNTSGTTWYVQLAPSHEIGPYSEDQSFLFEFCAYDGDDNRHILTGALTSALTNSEFTIEFATYKGFTGTQFPTISGDNTTTGVVNDLTAFSNTLDNGFIAYVLKHIKANGDVIRTVKKQSFTKTKAGANGAPGEGGAGVTYRGNWANDASVIYNSSDVRKDVVKFNGDFYIANYAAADTFLGNITPPNATYWDTFGAQFESVATDILFAEDVYANRTVNIGTGVGGNPVISLNADSASGYASPFISIGQTTQAFEENGIYFGYPSSSQSPALSMVSGSSYFIYNDGAIAISDAVLQGTGSSITGPSIKVGRKPNTEFGVTDARGYNFSVSTNGVVSASAAFIEGKINANSGKIGDWIITEQDSIGSYADDEIGVLQDTDGEIRFNPNTAEIGIYSASVASTISIESRNTASVNVSNGVFQIDMYSSGSEPQPDLHLVNAKYKPIAWGTNVPNAGYYFDLSSASLAGHQFSFSRREDGLGTYGGRYNHPTTLDTSETGQQFQIITSSEAPGTSGAYIQITITGSMVDPGSNPLGGYASGYSNFWYYCENHTGMGGAVRTYQTSADAANNVYEYEKRVSISSQNTFTEPGGNSQTFSWAGSNTQNGHQPVIQAQTLSGDSTTSGFNYPNTAVLEILTVESPALTVDAGSVKLSGFSSPSLHTRGTNIPDGEFTGGFPNYPPSYEGQLHGFSMTNTPISGYRSITSYVEILNSNDVVVKTQWISQHTKYGARDAYGYYIAVDNGYQSVVGNTNITISDGTTKLAKDITSTDVLLTWDNLNNQWVSSNISNIYKRDVTELYYLIIDGKELEVSLDHRFWLSSNSLGVSIGVSAKAIHDAFINKSHENDENLKLWVKEGNSKKKVTVSFIEKIQRDEEVITFSVPKYKNYITNEIVSHNMMGFDDLGWNYIQQNGSSPQGGNGNASTVSNATGNWDIPATGAYTVRYKVLCRSRASRSITVGQTSSQTVTISINAFSSQYGPSNSYDYYFQGGYAVTTSLTSFSENIDISRDNNFLEITPAGMQVVSGTGRYVRINRREQTDSNPTLLEVIDGSIKIQSRNEVTGTTSTGDKNAIEADGNIEPITNNLWDLGSSSKRFANLNGVSLTDFDERIVKAHCRFRGTASGNATILTPSYNVSSINRNSTGAYTVNLSDALTQGSALPFIAGYGNLGDSPSYSPTDAEHSLNVATKVDGYTMKVTFKDNDDNDNQDPYEAYFIVFGAG